MGKHSRREVGLVKKTAFASAATIGATAVLSNPAQAAEVVVPTTGRLMAWKTSPTSTPFLASISGCLPWLDRVSR